MNALSTRFVSLDIFRGLTVALMILVNNQYIGSAFDQLRHKEWNGCTLTDLVFPFFLFIVGASFWFVARRYEFKFNSAFARKMFVRAVKIFAVGVILNWYGSFSSLSELRVMGVLQRIALVYLLGGYALLLLKTRARIMISVFVILVSYWLILLLGGGFSLQNNIVTLVDSSLLTEAHLYRGYGVPFDPEGLLSTIPAIATMFIGYLSSLLMNRTDMELIVRIKNLFWAGFGCLILGFLFDSVMPINKPIWSSSYVLLSGGWAMISWSLISFVVDSENRIKWGKPFLVFGTNAIFAYALSGIIAKPLYSLKIFNSTIPSYFQNCVNYIFSENMVTLLWGIFFVGIVWIITYPLYKRNIFIKL